MHHVFRLTFIGLILSSACGATAAEKVYRGMKSVYDGNHFHEVVHLDLAGEEFPSKVLSSTSVMPKLQTLVVAGPRYTDEYLHRFAKIASLRFLVLDSTDLTDQAIERLRQDRPELVVYRSQRWAIAKIRGLAREAWVDSRRLNDSQPKLRELLGNEYFEEATRVDFSKLPDDETGPSDKILNEDLMPLKYLSTVMHLDLNWTRINDAGMHYIKNLVNLEYLRIPLADVSDEGMKHLEGLVNLKRLYTQGIGMPAEDLPRYKRLRDALPQCWVNEQRSLRTVR